MGAVIGGINGAVAAGQSLGWTRDNTLTIISAAAVGAVAGAFGAWWTPFGTAGFAANVANNMYAGAVGGFFGNLIGQKVAQPECDLDVRQATLQGGFGMVAGLGAGVAYGPFSVSNAPVWAAGIGGFLSTGGNALLPTSLGGFARPSPYQY
jgi:hypothetical protein